MSGATDKGKSLCVWHRDADDSDDWSTECKNEWVMYGGSPTECNMKFCPFCGRLLKEKLAAASQQ